MRRLLVVYFLIIIYLSIFVECINSDDYYYEKALEFSKQSMFKSTEYCLLKHLNLFPNDWRAKLSLSNSYETIEEYELAYWLSIDAIREFPGAFERAESIRRKMTDVNLKSIDHCFLMNNQIGESEKETIIKWLKKVWLERSDQIPLPSVVYSFSTFEIGCLLNQTFDISRSLIDLMSQVEILSSIDRFDLAETILNHFGSKFPNSDEYVLRSKLFSVYLRSGRLEDSITFIRSNERRFGQRDWFISVISHIIHDIGYTKEYHSIILKSWQSKLQTWLRSKPLNPPSCCNHRRRRIINDWFSDDNCLKVIQVNESFTDRMANIIQIEDCDILPFGQLQTECSRYLFGAIRDWPVSESKNQWPVYLEHVIVTGPMQQNYYHSIIDEFTRLSVIIDYFRLNGDLNHLQFLVHSKTLIEALKLIGIRKKQIILWNPLTIYKAKIATIVDWEEIKTSNSSLRVIQQIIPPRWALINARNSLMNSFNFEIELKTQLNVIYIFRGMNNSIRSFFDEYWLIYHLRKLTNKYGAQLSIHQGSGSLVDQAKLFNSANIVIGAHGAGLANIIFCQPMSSIIEFAPQNKLWNIYGYLSTALDLDYWIVPEMNTTYYGWYYIDRQRLDSIINTLTQVIEKRLKELK